MQARSGVPLWISILLIAGACSGGAEPETGVFLAGRFDTEEFVSFEVPSDDMRYLIWFPPSYAVERDRRFPLIVFLHGSGDPDFDEQWVQSYGLPEVLVSEGPPEGFEFVVVAPQAEPGSAWWSGRQTESVAALTEQVIADHRVDPERVVITGLSMGGYGSWHVATERPDLYSALVSVSGSGYGGADLPADIDVCGLRSVPIRAVHGQQDPIALYGLIGGLLDDYEVRCGVEIVRTVYPDLGHFAAFDTVYRDPELYRWMLSP